MKTSPSSSRWDEASKRILFTMEKTVLKYLSVVVVSLGLSLTASLASAQGRVAVVDLEQAILQTDVAQQRLANIRSQDDYTADAAELESLKVELDEIFKDTQKNAATMSNEQKQAASKRIANKRADAQHIASKLQKAEQEAGQQLLQDLTPKVQEVLRDLIASEGIGLLLQRQAVIHADNGYSITAKVTDKLNQQAAAEQ
jgi:outer membrane protein